MELAHCHGNMHALVQPLHAWRNAGDAAINRVRRSPLQSPPSLPHSLSLTPGRAPSIALPCHLLPLTRPIRRWLP
jgi:hypothetical protein